MKGTWFAVQRDPSDEWGFGSFDYHKAVSMYRRILPKYPDALIAVIERDTCIGEIRPAQSAGLNPKELAEALAEDALHYDNWLPFIDRELAEIQLEGSVDDELIDSFDDEYVDQFVEEWNRIAKETEEGRK